MQSIMAPMVLENLACTGTEERLVDCPGSRDPPGDGFDPDYIDIHYGFKTDGCDPLSVTYAFVACGTETAPGVPICCSRSRCARLYTYMDLSSGPVRQATQLQLGSDLVAGCMDHLS